MRKPGLWAMLRTFVGWWRLWLAGVLDEHATEPPPAVIATAVRKANWSPARVANYYEGLLSDKLRDQQTYIDRARDVEAKALEARAQGYWEGVRRGKALAELEDRGDTSARLDPVPPDIEAYWQKHGPQVLPHLDAFVSQRIGLEKRSN